MSVSGIRRTSSDNRCSIANARKAGTGKPHSAGSINKSAC